MFAFIVSALCTHIIGNDLSSLIEIAKYIIVEEINAPSWKVDSLLCATYFSIFYLKPDLELYRPCDNPRCGHYFLVKTTSTRNRFCSQECCNRVTQDRYRKRKRKKKAYKKRTSVCNHLQTEVLIFISFYFLSTPYGAGGSATIDAARTGVVYGIIFVIGVSPVDAIAFFSRTVSIHSARATFSFIGLPE